MESFQESQGSREMSLEKWSPNFLPCTSPYSCPRPPRDAPLPNLLGAVAPDARSQWQEQGVGPSPAEQELPLRGKSGVDSVSNRSSTLGSPHHTRLALGFRCQDGGCCCRWSVPSQQFNIVHPLNYEATSAPAYDFMPCAGHLHRSESLSNKTEDVKTLYNF